MTEKMICEIYRPVTGSGAMIANCVSLPRAPWEPQAVTLGPRPETDPRRGVMQHPRRVHPLVAAALEAMQ